MYQQLAKEKKSLEGFECAVCSKKFLSETSRNDHIDENHGTLLDNLMDVDVAQALETSLKEFSQQQQNNEAALDLGMLDIEKNDDVKSFPVVETGSGGAQTDDSVSQPQNQFTGVGEGAVFQENPDIPQHFLIESALQALLSNPQEVWMPSVKILRKMLNNCKIMYIYYICTYRYSNVSFLYINISAGFWQL